MRIVVVHNFYQQPGGEDQVFAAEVGLLRSYGHDVAVFTRHNDSIEGKGRLALLKQSIWNNETSKALGELIRSHRAEIAHFHNIFPVISPSAYSAARKNGAAVVQTLHNYRLLCPGALFYREGKVCEDCLHQPFAFSAIRNKCYRGSFAATAATATIYGVHRLMRTWHRRVDRFLALSAFGRAKFIEGGLPESRVGITSNFLPVDPGSGDGKGGYALFVGRLTKDKGVETLLQAWKQLGIQIPLKIVGNGPLRAEADALASNSKNVETLGQRKSEEVQQLMRDAACLIFPSEWYEGQPRTVIESLAAGTPVIASRIGVLPEMLTDGKNASFFEAGNPDSLAQAVSQFWQSADRPALRDNARETFLKRYTGERNYRVLLDHYAIARRNYLNSRRSASRAGEAGQSAELEDVNPATVGPD